MNRRNFIKGLLALPLLSLIPTPLPLMFGRIDTVRFVESPPIPLETIQQVVKALDAANVPQEDRWAYTSEQANAKNIRSTRSLSQRGPPFTGFSRRRWG